MKDLQAFLLFCSGADDSILRRSPSDVNKFVGIGGTVLFTAVLAALSGGYAAYTFSDSVWISIGFGLIWGLMIFNLDRYIVSSLKRRGNLWTDVLYALPRLAIAVVIAMVISKPIELKLFEKEINAEIVLMEQEMFAAQEQAVKDRFLADRDRIEGEIAQITAENTAAFDLWQSRSEEAVAEADGTGGSMIRNMGPIYKLKQAEADKAKANYEALLVTNQELIAAKQAELDQLDADIALAMAELEQQPMDGLAYRMEGLDRITSRYPPVKAGHVFIVFLFLLIESTPVLVKLISSRSPYDYHLHVHEQVVELYHEEVTKKRKNATQATVQFDHDVTMHEIYGEIRVQRARIDEEVREKIERIKNRQAGTETA